MPFQLIDLVLYEATDLHNRRMCDCIVHYSDDAITWNKHKKYASVLAIKFPSLSALVNTLLTSTPTFKSLCHLKK